MHQFGTGLLILVGLVSVGWFPLAGCWAAERRWPLGGRTHSFVVSVAGASGVLWTSVVVAGVYQGLRSLGA